MARMPVQTVVSRRLSIAANCCSTKDSLEGSHANRPNVSSTTAGASHEADRRLARVSSISSYGPSTSPEPPFRLSIAMAAAASASPADIIRSRKEGTRKEEVGPTQKGEHGRQGRGAKPGRALLAPSPTCDNTDTYRNPGTPEHRSAVTVLCAPTQGLSFAPGRARAIETLIGGVAQHTAEGGFGGWADDTSRGASPVARQRR